MNFRVTDTLAVLVDRITEQSRLINLDAVQRLELVVERDPLFNRFPFGLIALVMVGARRLEVVRRVVAVNVRVGDGDVIEVANLSLVEAPDPYADTKQNGIAEIGRRFGKPFGQCFVGHSAA